MTTLIAKPKGVGVGNLIQFIPAALKLGNICCDHEIYEILGVCETYKGQKVDRVVIPMFANWEGVLRTRLRFPFAEIIGYKYRIKGHFIGLFLTKAIQFDFTKSERWNYENNFIQ